MMLAGPLRTKPSVPSACRVLRGSVCAGPTLLVVRGSTAKPVFEQVPVAAGKGGAPAVVELQPAKGGALLENGGAAAAQGGAQGPAGADWDAQRRAGQGRRAAQQDQVGGMLHGCVVPAGVHARESEA